MHSQGPGVDTHVRQDTGMNMDDATVPTASPVLRNKTTDITCPSMTTTTALPLQQHAAGPTDRDTPRRQAPTPPFAYSTFTFTFTLTTQPAEEKETTDGNLTTCRQTTTTTKTKKNTKMKADKESQPETDVTTNPPPTLTAKGTMPRPSRQARQGT